MQVTVGIGTQIRAEYLLPGQRHTFLRRVRGFLTRTHCLLPDQGLLLLILSRRGSFFLRRDITLLWRVFLREARGGEVSLRRVSGDELRLCWTDPETLTEFNKGYHTINVICASILIGLCITAVIVKSEMMWMGLAFAFVGLYHLLNSFIFCNARKAYETENLNQE